MGKLYSYRNGNVNVELYEDGTKIREYEGEPHPVHPESIDVKITNYCDAGCSYCHEMSDESGKHGNLNRLMEVLNKLPSGVELAIGGGNALSHPKLYSFLQQARLMGWVCNITVNQRHLSNPLLSRIIQEGLVMGVGISYSSKSVTVVHDIRKILRLSDNVVFHIINGISSPDIVDELININDGRLTKILLLGYKDYGRGAKYLLGNERIERVKYEWLVGVRELLGKNVVMSFDNLAIEQVRLKRFFPEREWEKFYMGDDFVHTMYIDGVEGMFAPTSTSVERVSFESKELLKYFQDKC